MPTFRNTLSVPRSWCLNFICRRFGTLCPFHVPGVWILYADVSEHFVRSMFLASEFYMPTFRNTLSFPYSWHLNFICWRFGILYPFHIPGVWILYADVSEHFVRSMFLTSEFYMPTFRNTLSVPYSWRMPTFRNTLSVPYSWRLNFICRRFGILCPFRIPGIWILYADVSEYFVRSVFLASEFYMLTFRNTLSVPYSWRLNFICRRFEILCPFHIHGIWILYADFSEYFVRSVFLTSEFYMPTFQNTLSVPYSWRLNFICRRFGTLCLFHLHRRFKHTTYKDGTECSETSTHKIQAPGKHPKVRIQHSKHEESFKSTTVTNLTTKSQPQYNQFHTRALHEHLKWCNKTNKCSVMLLITSMFRSFLRWSSSG